MSWSIILFGVLPLLVFVVIDSVLGLKKALYGAMAAVIIEGLFSYIWLGTIDEVTVANFILVLIFAVISLKFKEAKYFKFQPAILSALVFLYLVTTWLMGAPILYELFVKYQDKLIEAVAETPKYVLIMESPLMAELFKSATLTVGIAHLVHANLVYYAALKFNNWWWLLMRMSIWPLMFFAMLGAYRMLLV